MELLSIASTRPSQDLRMLYAIIMLSGRPLTRASCQASSRRAFSTHYPRRLNPSTATSTPEASSSSSSVSASEISHFTRLASSWWDPHGPSRLLHLMNPLRHDFIKTCLASAPSSTIPDPNPTLHLQPTSNPTVSPKHTILDIGCGGGIFSSSAARLPSTSRVVAIDPTPSVISVAKSHARSDPVLSDPNKLSYLNCSLDDLHSQVTLSSPSSSSSSSSSIPPSPQIPSKYDLITIFELLEHILHPAPFLRTATSYLEPGGWLIGSTIARHPLSFLTTKVIAEMPLFGVVPRGTHTWDQYINPAELEGWFAERNAEEQGQWGTMIVQGVIYLPGMGWKMVDGSESYGNYFFGVQKLR